MNHYHNTYVPHTDTFCEISSMIQNENHRNYIHIVYKLILFKFQILFSIFLNLKNVFMQVNDKGGGSSAGGTY